MSSICAPCNKIFETANEYELHTKLKPHKRNVNKYCECCGIHADTPAALLRHFETAKHKRNDPLHIVQEPEIGDDAEDDDTVGVDSNEEEDTNNIAQIPQQNQAMQPMHDTIEQLQTNDKIVNESVRENQIESLPVANTIKFTAKDLGIDMDEFDRAYKAKIETARWENHLADIDQRQRQNAQKPIEQQIKKKTDNRTLFQRLFGIKEDENLLGIHTFDNSGRRRA